MSSPQFWDDTPLHFAAASGQTETVKYLLENGAERDPYNRVSHSSTANFNFQPLLTLHVALAQQNRRPLELALEFNQDGAVKLLGGTV